VSNIALAHYVFQLVEDSLLDGEPDWLTNPAKQAPDQLLMDGNAAKKDLIVEDYAGECDQPVFGLYKRDIHFGHVHRRHLVPYVVHPVLQEAP
jgi:hypothetical protein